MLTEINLQLNRNIVGFGCSADIIQNFTKTAFGSYVCMYRRTCYENL
jgi:hypothetical protein